MNRKSTHTFLLFCFALFIFQKNIVYSQTYTHPTVGLVMSYAGACLVNTNTGTYYDDGGSGGNYALNINNVYRVFCPATVGYCMKATFTSFTMEGKVDPAGPSPLDCYYDYLTIGNGAAQNSTSIAITGVTSTPTTRICGTPTVPFSATSSAGSGCLIFRFRSDNTVTMAGWAATLSTVACATGPNGTDNNDCSRATPLCTDLTITTNSTGPGLNSETCSSCIQGGEHHSNWYTWTMFTGGTLGFVIDPTVNTDDYDFALYGPITNCSGIGTPKRCSYSDDFDITGLSAAETDISEDVTGNSYVDTVHVKAGEKYYLFIDHWTPPSSGYVLDIQLTDGASLDCSALTLPLQLIDYTATSVGSAVLLQWTTMSEQDNSFFTIDKSSDGINYEPVATVPGKGSSANESYYMVNDNNPHIGANYYRLSETNENGDSRVLDIEYANHAPVASPEYVSIYDLSGREISAFAMPSNSNEDVEKLIYNLHISNGIYIYKIKLSNGTIITGKMVNAK